MSPLPPEVPFDAIGSHHWEAIEDEEWVARPFSVRCRYRHCENAPAATLFRGKRKLPYTYCAEHMYGRWVQDGRVFDWRLRANA